jgi:hypothetical protein
MKMVIEKRKYVRFLAQPDTYAAIGSGFTKIGKIRNISMGGLAFDYYSDTGDTEDVRHYDSKVIIFTADNLYLEKMPCRMIYNFPKCSSNQAVLLSSNYPVKRYGLKFMTIPEGQSKRLEHFIHNYTQGIAAASIKLKNQP